ncbi:hypothetical protein M404DRAFT_998522 [Pisolithus tinctorius Marx 270]|uniref:Uncharacterized protein n=1 Tax=Pisolithus tinctorius Marx 270 TaxID=870435 RepID=A0A0C3JDD7_PISTI|nr:hypothetical protein M404DRAFT_998522 [Pisolithus tinctorius Marx 270]
MKCVIALNCTVIRNRQREKVQGKHPINQEPGQNDREQTLKNMHDVHHFRQFCALDRRERCIGSD